MKKRNIIIISICAAALVISGITLGIILGANSKKKRNLYDLGVKHLVDGEYEAAAEIFGDPYLKNYKDTPKKYNYSFNLQRYEQHIYSYEDLIDYGLKEEGSIASIDFDTNGGKEIERKTIDKQQEDKYITVVAEKEHYDFISWNLNYACYEQATDSIRYALEANYSDRRYEINYELNGGNTPERLPRYYYYNNGAVSIPDLTKKGNTFSGYESNLVAGTVKNFVIPNGTAQDIELTAKFSPNTYTISFDGNGAPNPSPRDVVYGSDVRATFPTVSKSYYTFDYWTYNGQEVNLESWNIADNVTLVAHYTETQYAISYNLHGATNPGLPETCGYSSRIYLPYLEKEGAIFIGWKKVGSGVVDPKVDYLIANATTDFTMEAIFVDATIDGTGKLTGISDLTIKSLAIPSFVNDISTDLFCTLTNLLNIYADPSNEHFTVDENHNLLIKNGNVAFAYAVGAPVANPALEVVNLPDEINEIGEGAFRGTSITEVNGSNYIQRINANAFYGCTALEECNLENINYVGNSAFENTKVDEAFLTANEDTLAHIGDYAFKSSSVDALNITDKVQHIGDNAFSSLTGLTSVSFYPNNNCVIGDDIFADCSNLKTLNTDSKFFDKLVSDTSYHLQTVNLTGSTNISANVCENYTSLESLNLTSISLSTTINQIGANAFKGATSLETATLPASLRRIKSGAFDGCEKLDTVNFIALEDLFQIEENAFRGTAFTSLDFTHNPHLTIENGAFSECSDLTSITMYHGQIVTRIVDVFKMCGKIDSVTYYIEETDNDIIVPGSLFESLNNVTSISFIYEGSDNKEISYGNYAFKNCASLTDISMTRCHVSSLPYHCFDGCKVLTNANGNFSNLTSYGDGAFEACQQLNHMTFTTDLVYIGADAFAGCYSLLTLSPLVIPHNDDLKIGLGAFADITGELQLDYTSTDVADYKTTYNKWYNFDYGFSGTFTYLR